jgi:hypothetical protein
VTMKTETNGAERFGRCDRCIFAEADGGGGYFCLAHAPRVLAIPTPANLPNPPPVTVLTYWPRVTADQWCGDFDPKPQLVN